MYIYVSIFCVCIESSNRNSYWFILENINDIHKFSKNENGAQMKKLILEEKESDDLLTFQGICVTRVSTQRIVSLQLYQ